MTEMSKLGNLLLNTGIPFEVVINPMTHTPMIKYPNNNHNKCICSVICHDFSYGGKQGLLEIMGLTKDDVEGDVEGWLTANEVFVRIFKDYHKV